MSKDVSIRRNCQQIVHYAQWALAERLRAEAAERKIAELARSIPSLAGAVAEADREATEEENQRPVRRPQAMSFTTYSHPERE